MGSAAAADDGLGAGSSRAATVAQRGPSASFTSSKLQSVLQRRGLKLAALEAVQHGNDCESSKVVTLHCGGGHLDWYPRCRRAQNPGGQRITSSVFLLTLNCRDRRRTEAGRIDIDCPFADQVACRIAGVDRPSPDWPCGSAYGRNNWRLDAQGTPWRAAPDRGLPPWRMQRLANVAPEQDKSTAVRTLHRHQVQSEPERRAGLPAAQDLGADRAVFLDSSHDALSIAVVRGPSAANEAKVWPVSTS